MYHERTVIGKERGVNALKFLLRSGTGVASGSEGERPKAPRIAVVDSGVHVGNPHVRHVDGGVGIDELGRIHADFVDRLGHGTAVTAAILEKAPHSEILAVRVFDRELSTTCRALVSALQWARAENAQLVNLSLGTTNADHEALLVNEIEAAKVSGVLIVCAAPQEGCRWLPGALPGVIRVEVDMAMPRECCEVAIDDGGRISARASGFPRPIPGVPPERNLKGLSFAVANVSGILAATWQAEGGWPDWCQRRG
jgi:subtilisin family serine protease